jgi:hypothetical protein
VVDTYSVQRSAPIIAAPYALPYWIVTATIQVNRSPQGDALDAETLIVLRTLLADQGARRVKALLGLSIPALTRAAAGLRVLAGTRALIRTAIDRLDAAGELPGTPPKQREGSGR